MIRGGRAVEDAHAAVPVKPGDDGAAPGGVLRPPGEGGGLGEGVVAVGFEAGDRGVRAGGGIR